MAPQSDFSVKFGACRHQQEYIHIPVFFGFLRLVSCFVLHMLFLFSFFWGGTWWDLSKASRMQQKHLLPQRRKPTPWIPRAQIWAVPTHRRPRHWGPRRAAAASLGRARGKAEPADSSGRSSSKFAEAFGGEKKGPVGRGHGVFPFLGQGWILHLRFRPPEKKRKKKCPVGLGSL